MKIMYVGVDNLRFTVEEEIESTNFYTFFCCIVVVETVWETG